MNAHVGFSRVRVWQEWWLSPNSQQALQVARFLLLWHGSGKDVTAKRALSDLAHVRDIHWTERTLYRRFETLRRELARSDRVCRCGCYQLVPLNRKGDARYVDDEHKQKAYVKLRRARAHDTHV